MKTTILAKLCQLKEPNHRFTCTKIGKAYKIQQERKELAKSFGKY